MRKVTFCLNVLVITVVTFVNESVMKALWEMVIGPLNRCHAEQGFIIF